MAAQHSTAQLPPFLRQAKSDLHAKFIDLEWQQRERVLLGTKQPTNPNHGPSPWARVTGEETATRNRYVNVEPYEQNRIKLKVAPGVNDYINASPIRLGKRTYIATQGPKDTSVNHFYRMVAQELKSPAVVVMLTQTHEAGKEKCFQYYPLTEQESPLSIPPDHSFGDDFQGEVQLVSVQDDMRTRSQLRTMRLKVSNQDMEIRHLLFEGWPDFLVPEGEDRAALIELVRLSASLNQPSTQTNGSASTNPLTTDDSNPRIVHCSAGVGRSGTFIALDYLLSQLHSGKLDTLPADGDPVAETVDLLRQQRMMMVQGESQFMFLYEAVREQFLARNRERGAVAVAGRR